MSDFSSTILGWLNGSPGQVALAGLFGAVVNALFEWQGWLATWRKIFIGTVSAYFLGPLGIPILQWLLGKFDVPLQSSASVGGFIMGLIGVFFVETLLIAIKEKKRALLEKDEDDTPETSS